MAYMSVRVLIQASVVPLAERESAHVADSRLVTRFADSMSGSANVYRFDEGSRSACFSPPDSPWESRSPPVICGGSAEPVKIDSVSPQKLVAHDSSAYPIYHTSQLISTVSPSQRTISSTVSRFRSHTTQPNV
jgi:hypothetical protein